MAAVSNAASRRRKGGGRSRCGSSPGGVRRCSFSHRSIGSPAPAPPLSPVITHPCVWGAETPHLYRTPGANRGALRFCVVRISTTPVHICPHLSAVLSSVPSTAQYGRSAEMKTRGFWVWSCVCFIYFYSLLSVPSSPFNICVL